MQNNGSDHINALIEYAQMTGWDWLQPYMNPDEAHPNWSQKCIVHMGTGVRILVTAITFSCAVYNLEHHQRPVPLIRCLYGMEGSPDPLSQ